MKKIRTTRRQRWAYIIASNPTILLTAIGLGNIWIALALFPNWIMCDRLITWGKEYESLISNRKPEAKE